MIERAGLVRRPLMDDDGLAVFVILVFGAIVGALLVLWYVNKVLGP